MTRCGTIALLGAPNAGKSTLLNQMIGSKLAIVSPKPQTTRQRLHGIMVHGNAQLIFADVPGVFSAQERYERTMVDVAWQAVAGADVVLVVVDAARGFDKRVEAALQQLMEQRPKHAALALNKIDLVADKRKLLSLISELSQSGLFEEIFPIAAVNGEGTDALKDYLARTVPESPFLYDEDALTDMPERVLAAEITREHLFHSLRHEVPYSLMVETEQWEERKDGSVKIHQVITVERDSQKGIVLGARGAGLKALGQASREEIAAMLGRPVHLFLFVKVREDWKNDAETLRNIGQ